MNSKEIPGEIPIEFAAQLQKNSRQKIPGENPRRHFFLQETSGGISEGNLRRKIWWNSKENSQRNGIGNPLKNFWRKFRRSSWGKFPEDVFEKNLRRIFCNQRSFWRITSDAFLDEIPEEIWEFWEKILGGAYWGNPRSNSWRKSQEDSLEELPRLIAIENPLRNYWKIIPEEFLGISPEESLKSPKQLLEKF